MDKVLLCAIAKQENLYIKEWVDYHLKLGFDHITIYDNNETDGERISDVIGGYQNVNIINFRGKHQKSCETQVAAYNACYKGASSYDWVMFMDIDEFLWFRDYDNIKSFLGQNWVKRANVIRFHWKCYSDSGKLNYEDAPVTERFTEECKNAAVNYYIKQLYRTNLGTLRIVNVHYTNHVNNIYYPDGKLAPYITTTKDKNMHDTLACIKHYVTKSLEEYVKIKYARRSAGSSKTRLNLDFYFKYNDKTDEKLKYYKTLINELKDNESAGIKKKAYQKKRYDGVSVCITAYEAQDYIEECLDSVAKQTWFATHDNWEVIVGIDGCEKTLEKVKEIMHKYKNLRVLMMDSNMGTYVTSNTLANESRYEYIMRFDSDDVMLPNMVEYGMGIVNENNVIRFCFENFGELAHLRKKKVDTAHGIMLYHYRLFYKIGGYRNWKCSGDSDFIQRCIYCGYNVVKSDLVTFKRRLHKNSLTTSENTCIVYVNEKLTPGSLRTKYREIMEKNKTDKTIAIKTVYNTYKEIL